MSEDRRVIDQKVIHELKDAVLGFIAAVKRRELPSSRWLQVDPIKVYIRYGRRLVNGERHIALTIANIDVDEALQKRGYFTTFLKKCLDICQEQELVLFVESVCSEHVERVLKREGFSLIGEGIFMDWYKLY